MDSVVVSSADDSLPLLCVDCFFRRSETIGAASLYLDKDESLAVARDEVHFSGSPARPIVARDYRMPVRLQIAVCEILTASTPRVRGISGLQPLTMPQPVRQAV